MRAWCGQEEKESLDQNECTLKPSRDSPFFFVLRASGLYPGYSSFFGLKNMKGFFKKRKTALIPVLCNNFFTAENGNIRGNINKKIVCRIIQWKFSLSQPHRKPQHCNVLYHCPPDSLWMLWIDTKLNIIILHCKYYFYLLLFYNFVSQIKQHSRSPHKS